MIGRLKGIVLEKKAPDLLLDVNGVGYELQAPMSTFYQLPASGQGVVLHTHLVVREDAHLLFGFYDEQERALFRALIRVSGVGPKVALAILSGVTADEFVRLVRHDDDTALTRIPGIGKKTAERLLLEMRDRLKDWQSPAASGDAAGAPQPASGGNAVSEDAETALIALGYKPAEAARMIVRTLKDNPGLERSEEIIRLALKGMV
ncbi:Holliday junction branch migration protein RuvA [Pseudohongiella sp.]|uniref:Helix-hairpin-helix DNA-binding motif class 1 domain-containing protein n=1 Tax=marine sediment metagenome TaxID=412755 RepID=A0A0F9WGQ0_9ZZZZ|nr:Holliday junction branch migration protein RuvA [Pseudohongiella sp.]HDZ09124.1 Holliday junction branch migration protein RuvA [Pseudohongiella sp.]HEA63540.1 Holliday junction branch migration protein RuvA [Pseudohongiella sp.]